MVNRAQTVSANMSRLVVCFVLHVMLATVVTCQVKLKKIPSHHKESSTTFLRLTALRDDEGLWVARFGEYEISIELKRHPKSAWRKTAEDTWTLKIKHTSTRFETKRNDDEAYHNNEFPSEIQSSTGREGPWHKIADGVDTDVQTFNKLRRSGRARKEKSRRQLSQKSQIRTKHNASAIPTEHKVTQQSVHEQPILKKLLRDASSRTSNDTVHVDNTDETFEEVHATPWGNIAAVMYDSPEIRTMTVENKPKQLIDQQETNSTESSINYEHDKLTEPYALPLHQTEDGKRLETDKGQNSLDDSNERKTIHEYNYNGDRWKGSEGVDADSYGDRISGLTTERTDVADTSDQEQPTDIMTDYVIEDPTPREYDILDVGNEEQQDTHGVTDDSQEDFEPTAEMKRLMNWFPRSRLLTTENNGYKLFPGVGWFKLITWPERWSNARRSCELEQAHLAIPDTKQKVRVLLQIFKNYPDVLEQAILHRQVYVGVYSYGHDRNFSTVLGKPFVPEFPIWFPNEPDNADPGEECVTFHAEGKLRDVPCFYNLPFLCEKHIDIP